MPDFPHLPGPAVEAYRKAAAGDDVCHYCGHEFGASLVDRPDFCPECGERGNLVTEWDQSEVLVTANAALREADELVGRLQCCGSCGYCETADAGSVRCYESTPYERVNLGGDCRFTPSRWKQRGANHA